MLKEIIEKIMERLRAGGGQRVSYRFVLNRLKEDEKVLDVGCGFGRFDEKCAKNGIDITGIDPYDRTDKPSFRYINDDFLTWNPEGEEVFDVIISLSAIEHFGMNTYENKVIDDEAPRKALEKMVTMARKRVIITIPVGGDGDSHWFRCFDEERLDELLSGFNIVEKIFVACDKDWKKWSAVSPQKAFASHWLKSKIPSALVCFVIEKEEDIGLDVYNKKVMEVLEKKGKYTDRVYFDKVLKHVEQIKPWRILEIGCGKGNLLKKIAKEMPEIELMGCDPCLTTDVKGFNYEGVDWEDFGDDAHDQYGMIICLNVLHYVLNLGNFLEKASKYLSEDGEFYGCVPSGDDGKHVLNINLFKEKNLRRLLSFYFEHVFIQKWKNYLFFTCRGGKYE